MQMVALAVWKETMEGEREIVTRQFGSDNWRISGRAEREPAVSIKQP